jgi:hypothetical protein
MPPITITEALAELKTVEKRIAKKREFVLSYLLRQEMLKDPLEKDGGSVSALRRELQAIHDLEEWRVAIRRAIRRANDEATITIGKQTRSIADWLAWRREVAPGLTRFLAQMRQRIEHARQEATRRGGGMAQLGEPVRSNDVIVNLNEQELARDIEALEEVLGALDGQLSLKNATLTVDV